MATPRARQGRRDPALLQATSDPEGPEIDLDEAGADEPDEESGHPLLFPGETLHYKLTVPIVIEGSNKESYIGGEAEVIVQDGETFYETSARAREAVLRQFLDGIDETERAIARYAELRSGQ